MSKKPAYAADVADALQRIANGSKIFRKEKRDALKALSDLYFMVVITVGRDIDLDGPNRLLSAAAKSCATAWTSPRIFRHSFFLRWLLLQKRLPLSARLSVTNLRSEHG